MYLPTLCGGVLRSVLSCTMIIRTIVFQLERRVLDCVVCSGTMLSVAVWWWLQALLLYVCFLGLVLQHSLVVAHHVFANVTSTSQATNTVCDPDALENLVVEATMVHQMHENDDSADEASVVVPTSVRAVEDNVDEPVHVTSSFALINRHKEIEHRLLGHFEAFHYRGVLFPCTEIMTSTTPPEWYHPLSHFVIGEEERGTVSCHFDTEAVHFILHKKALFKAKLASVHLMLQTQHDLQLVCGSRFKNGKVPLIVAYGCFVPPHLWLLAIDNTVQTTLELGTSPNGSPPESIQEIIRRVKLAKHVDECYEDLTGFQGNHRVREYSLAFRATRDDQGRLGGSPRGAVDLENTELRPLRDFLAVCVVAFATMHGVHDSVDLADKDFSHRLFYATLYFYHMITATNHDAVETMDPFMHDGELTVERDDISEEANKQRKEKLDDHHNKLLNRMNFLQWELWNFTIGEVIWALRPKNEV